MIGQTIWVFDENRRVYDPQTRQIIRREHWRSHTITGETKQSWTYQYGVTFKVPKNPKLRGNGIAFSQEEIDRLDWAQSNAWKIAYKVQVERDHDKLKRIEAILAE